MAALAELRFMSVFGRLFLDFRFSRPEKKMTNERQLENFCFSSCALCRRWGPWLWGEQVRVQEWGLRRLQRLLQQVGAVVLQRVGPPDFKFPEQ